MGIGGGARPGYGGYPVAMWATRSRGGAIEADERDAQVAAAASRATLVVDARYGGHG